MVWQLFDVSTIENIDYRLLKLNHAIFTRTFDRNANAPILKSAIDLGLTTTMFEETLLQVSNIPIWSLLPQKLWGNYCGEIIVYLYFHKLINVKYWCLQKFAKHFAKVTAETSKSWLLILKLISLETYDNKYKHI